LISDFKGCKGTRNRGWFGYGGEISFSGKILSKEQGANS
jgi:hypothetical protein